MLITKEFPYPCPHPTRKSCSGVCMPLPCHAGKTGPLSNPIRMSTPPRSPHPLASYTGVDAQCLDLTGTKAGASERGLRSFRQRVRNACMPSNIHVDYLVPSFDWDELERKMRVGKMLTKCQ
eukprot:scaffold321966_cov19-Tisochrysis_lutea.AAC.1